MSLIYTCRTQDETLDLKSALILDKRYKKKGIESVVGAFIPLDDFNKIIDMEVEKRMAAISGDHY